MTTDPLTILVVGSTGSIGRLVVAEALALRLRATFRCAACHLRLPFIPVRLTDVLFEPVVYAVQVLRSIARFIATA